jgi:glycosyltransferase involved in cell wall biosynthesis
MSHPLITLVVPVWGDDKLIADLVMRLPLNATTAEWVVAAVEPTELLRKLEQLGEIRLVECDRPSRGAQMNAGARKARGLLLCFHHADSELRREHLEALATAAGNEKIVGGAFHRQFDDRRFWMIKWEGLLRRINSMTGPLFGDQSIFVRADIFHELGGFADIPIMEDIEFTRRLRRVGRLVLLDPPLWSSPRRFRRLGNLRTSVFNAVFIVLFYFGVSPERLHRWYYRRRLDRRKDCASTVDAGRVP